MKNIKNILSRIVIIVLVFSSNYSFSQIAPEPHSIKTKQDEVNGKEYMIVTAHNLASKAAEGIINKGGNAIDAAIAAQMVLNVVEPQSSGIGGGGFLLYYDKKTNKMTSYDGRETAPSKAKPDMFLDSNGKAIPFMQAVRSGNAVGVPGLLAMLDMAHKEHGKLKWKNLFSPAIDLAKNGFTISNRLNASIAYANEHKMSEGFKRLYFDQKGNPLPVGYMLSNISLSKSLDAIAENGASYFYNSNITDSIVRAVNVNGGNLRKQDFANYKAKKRDVICSSYRGYKVCGMGLPSSGGITTLQTLGILEHFDLGENISAKSIHLIMEAQKLAYADRNHYLADSDKVQVPNASKLIDSSYLKKRAGLIDKSKASLTPVKAGVFDIINGQDSSYDAPSTTHISIVDNEGNAVSLTSSVEHSFGSGIVVNGFVLNNQLTDFSFYPEKDGKAVANAVAPNKRPRSSMSPTFIFDGQGDLYGVLGSPGGSSIIAYVIKTIIAIVDWGMPLKEAVDLPHFMHKNTKAELEDGQESFAQKLSSYGHKIAMKEKTSGLNAIIINDNQLIGYSDPRREGMAIGK